MGMQTDVLSSHLHQSGFIVQQQPSRIKAVSVKGNSISASQFDLYSTLTAPVEATYAQSGTTVTVTETAHGLSTGNLVGISFSENSPGTGAATSGNYIITVTNANTFTLTSPNTATVTAGAACNYVSGNGATWLLTLEFEIGDTYQNYFLLPGEGIRSKLKVYAFMDGVSVATVFYG